MRSFYGWRPNGMLTIITSRMAAVVSFAAAVALISAIAFDWRGTRIKQQKIDTAMAICDRHVLWNMPVENGGGAVTAPSRQYLEEWNARCRQIEQMAVEQAWHKGPREETKDKAFLDTLLKRGN